MSDQNTLPIPSILENISYLSLRTVFVIHFIFITWGVQGYWSPDSYFFYNLIFFATLIWSLHSKESEPVLFSLLINGLSMLFDLIVLCVYFPSMGSSEKFSGAMAIINLMLRPISCLALYKEIKQRMNNGPTDLNFAGSSTSKKSMGYDDV